MDLLIVGGQSRTGRPARTGRVSSLGRKSELDELLAFPATVAARRHEKRVAASSSPAQD